MKRILLSLLVTVTCSQVFAQYFEANITNDGNNLIFNVRPKPGGGNISVASGSEFSNIEFCVAYPNSQAADFTWGTPVTGANFVGANFAFKGNNEYGTLTNKTIARFQWLTDGANFAPTSGNLPKTFLDGQSYEVFRVPVVGIPPATVDFELTANPVTYAPAYIAITDRNNLPLDISAVGSGNAFYGTGFYVDGENQFVLLSDVPVPVKFTNFNVTKKESNALVAWSVENESVSTDRYEVERSANGVDFVKVATIAPNNASGSSNTYQHSDAIVSSGVVYYRIKQIDKDGKFIYSSIKNLRISADGLTLNVSPNPVKDITRVTLELPETTPVAIKITDASGREIRNIQLQGVKGTNIKPIDLSALASGNYMMKVIAGEANKTLPLIKIK